MTTSERQWPPKSKIDPSGPWTLSQGIHDEKPVLVRVNEGLRSIAGHPDYPDQIRIVVALRTPTKEGLPTEAEADELNVFEDALCDSLQSGNESILAVVLTSGGMREYVFYTSNQSAMKVKAPALGKKLKTHRIRFNHRSDPEWKIYKQFAGRQDQ